MSKQNLRLVAYAVAVLTILVAGTFLPASAQLSQWRSLNPTRGSIAFPAPTTPTLYSVHALSPTYAWAVGGDCDIFTKDGCPGSGIALQWDGHRWREVLVPADAGTLTSVYIASMTDAWAVGMGPTIIHWDGTSWVSAPVHDPPLDTIDDIYSVFIMPGGTSGWAVGDSAAGNNILRWSGLWPSGAWSVFVTPDGAASLRGVSLSSNVFGWIVGTVGTIFKWDGGGWIDITPTSTPTDNDLFSVSALSSSDAWAVGEADTIIRWNGAIWTGPMVAPTQGIDYRSIHMVGYSDGWIAGTVNPTTKEGILLRWDGTAWSIVRSWVTVDLNEAFVLAGGTTGWAVGNAETIITWDGSTWLSQTSPTSIQLNSVYLISPDNGWAMGDNGTIFRWNGISWSHYETLPSGQNLYGVFMLASNDAWAVGASPDPDHPLPPTILHWNGMAWKSVSPPGVALNERLNSVYMLSPTEGWSVGSSDDPLSASATALKWDGTIWASVPSDAPAPAELKSVHMINSLDGWAVGCDASCPTADLFASGSRPTIVRWNGFAWSAVTAPDAMVIGGLWSVDMLSATDGWAVGELADDGRLTIIHWDGSQWQRVVGPTAGDGSVLASVRMVSTSDGWAVGFDPTMLATIIVHWDGVTWNVVATLPIPPTLMLGLKSIFMVSSLDGWAVGEEGIILRYGPEERTTSTVTATSTLTSSATTTTTTAPPGPIPGFPIESMLAGLVVGVVVLAVLRRRRNVRS